MKDSPEELVALLLALLVFWTILGALIVLWATQPVRAFLRGAVAVATAGGLVLAASGFRITPSGQVLLVLCMPPAFVAGLAADHIHAILNKIHAALTIPKGFPLSPDAEQAARAHFDPKMPQAGEDAITRPARDVQEGGEE